MQSPGTVVQLMTARDSVLCQIRQVYPKNLTLIEVQCDSS